MTGQCISLARALRLREISEISAVRFSAAAVPLRVGGEVLGRIVDHVIAAQLHRDLSLRLRADGADHLGAQVLRPGHQQVAHA